MRNHCKVVILGAGHVGSHVAQAIAFRQLCEELVLVDTDEDKAAAQALDVADSLSSLDGEMCIRAGKHAECADADLVIVAIGEPRQPGQTRLDLLDRSVELLDVLIGQLRPLKLTCPVVTITNPADIVADYLRKHLNMPRSQCFGTGTLLDTARLRRIIAEMTGTDRRSVSAFALGEHGDSAVVPFSTATVGGIPLKEFGLDEKLVTEKTHLAGMDIIIGKGSTEFGIGAAAAVMASAILRDEHRILPASVLLQGEYGQQNVHCGVPCRIGAEGIEQIVELPLTEKEMEELNRSCEILRSHIAKAEKHSSLTE